MNASSFKVPTGYPPPDLEGHRILPVGKPRPGFSFSLRDRQGREIQESGKSGILVIHSPLLAQGYHAREDENRKTFYREKGKCFYNTGDKAFRLPSGDYLVCGREDRQVQIYGRRIELDEIENRLHQAPGVERAWVVDIRGNGWHKMCAYVKGQKDFTLLRHFLGKHLPSFMIPHHFESLTDTDNHQPWTGTTSTSQKVDYRHLREMALKKYSLPETQPMDDSSNFHSHSHSHSPSPPAIATATKPQPSPSHRQGHSMHYTDMVAFVKSIWMRHLGSVQNISPDDSFFEVGGDSVMAVEVYQDICQHFNIRLEPFVFYTSPTINKLTQKIQEAQKVKETQALPSPPIGIGDSDDSDNSQELSFSKKFSHILIVFKVLHFINRLKFLLYKNKKGGRKALKRGPLAPQQKHFIYFQQLFGYQYNGYFSADLKGKVEVVLLEKSLEKIVASQECLRTCFMGDQQLVFPPFTPRILFYDLSGLSTDQQKEHIAETNHTLLHKKFDLRQLPLFRVCLFKKSQENFALTFCMNHVLADGQSIQVFLSQLNQTYRGLPPAKSLSYIDYTLKYKQHCRKQYPTNNRFWSKKLAPLKEYNGNLQKQTRSKSLSEQTCTLKTQQIEGLAKKYQTIPFYILMTLWAESLSQFLGSAKIHFLITYHNRCFPLNGLSQTIAPFARMAPLLLHIKPSSSSSSSSSFADNLKHINHAYLEILNYVDFNIMKHTSDGRAGTLLGFNHLDLTTFSPSLKGLPSLSFHIDLSTARVRLSMGNYRYIYLYLSAHSLFSETRLYLYGICPNEDKQVILQNMKDRVEELNQPTSHLKTTPTSTSASHLKTTPTSTSASTPISHSRDIP